MLSILANRGGLGGSGVDSTLCTELCTLWAKQCTLKSVFECDVNLLILSKGHQEGLGRESVK